MNDNELITALLSRYVDKYNPNELNAGIADLPDDLQGRIYERIKRHPPDVDLATLLEISNQSEGEKTIWTVNELLDAEFPELNWLVPDLIPVGLVSLAGRPKVGKSWMALQLAIAVASGGRFMDKEVDRGGVLYLAFEDGKRRLQSRINGLKVVRDTPITFKTDYRNLNGEGLDDLYIDIESGFFKLVVVDTFGRSVGQIEIKDYSENVGILSPLQKLSQRTDTTILLVDHHGKLSASNPSIDLIGSIGKSGTFDTLVGLYRERGKQGATLAITGRDQEDVELSIEFDAITYCWQSLGDTRSVFEQSVLDAIKELVDIGELATTTNIADHIDAHKGHVSRSIANLLNDHLVKKMPKNGRLQPYEAL